MFSDIKFNYTPIDSININKSFNLVEFKLDYVFFLFLSKKYDGRYLRTVNYDWHENSVHFVFHTFFPFQNALI